ncbi:MAG: adenylate/guanylate cyclase domain-containing protein [Rhodospirillales bacterium]|nr:adenylate/guanylate cyclase domain-containing protein [Rhodospirillales bacterium]
MNEKGVQRRLSAILAADVVGYTRLMEQDSEGTVAAWQAARSKIIDPAIGDHSGRVVKHTGDGFLAEFPTVQDAVNCAVSMQQALAANPLDFRMGVNLGDIIDDGEDIHGEGVNVAARLEGLAEPGGICISGGVYDQVRNRIDMAVDDMGEREVKHVSAPVRVYAIKPASENQAATASVQPAPAPAAPVPGFADRPAIAVLPFANMSGDPEQEYFADGIAEDILTRLAMWRWLPVIARNSSFVYKGQAVDVKTVGADLGARYVLEGSVRKSGDRARITGQLIDADTGHHVWADRYDRVLGDIFDVQDEITDAIAAALEPAVGRAEMERTRRKNPNDLDAWDLSQRGGWHFNQFTKEGFAAAIPLFEQAAALDPTFVQPLVGIAAVRIIEALLTWADNPPAALAEAHRMAEAAMAIDDLDPWSHGIMAYSLSYMDQSENAVVAARRAIELNPSFTLAHHALGVAHMFNGDAMDAVAAVETALRISPNDMWTPMWLGTLSASYNLAHDYKTALEIAKRGLQKAPKYPILLRCLANALGQLGRTGEAAEALARFLEVSPDYTEETARFSVHFKDEEVFQHYLEGLRKAGWQG